MGCWIGLGFEVLALVLRLVSSTQHWRTFFNTTIVRLLDRVKPEGRGHQLSNCPVGLGMCADVRA